MVPAPPLTIALPNGNTMKSHESTTLNLPLPPKATTTNIVPGINTNLTSLGQLCDAGCTATFDHKSVTIEHNGNTIIKGQHNQQSQLWHINTTYSNTKPNTDAHSATANTAWHTTTKKELLQFLHQCAGSPTVETW